MYLLFGFPVSLAFGGVPSIDISPVDSFLLFLQGGVLMPLSFGLLTVGPSFISAPEVSLYMLLETILGPVLVFFAGYEKPPMMSIYGGIIIVVALAANRYKFPLQIVFFCVMC